jgi:O-antigen/teichoic acid export membrane protein
VVPVPAPQPVAPAPISVVPAPIAYDPNQPQPQIQYVQVPVQQVQVQAVKNIQDLHGLGGWLMFFLICFVLSSLSFFSVTIFGIFTPTNTVTSIVTAIFAPLIFSIAALSATLIILQQKIARYTSIAVYGVSVLFTATTTITALTETSITGGAAWGSAIVSIFASLLVSGLLSLYFIQSKRVKETLVKDNLKSKYPLIFIGAGIFAGILLLLGVIFSATAKPQTSYHFDCGYDSSYSTKCL